jgi:translation initiation factor IF-2
LSPKKRVYELAKEYGMSGQDLAAKLRDMGFTQIKSHMAALDDPTLLQVQGALEAHGLVTESASRSGLGGPDGLIVRRKKKTTGPTAPASPALPPAAPAPSSHTAGQPGGPTTIAEPAAVAGDRIAEEEEPDTFQPEPALPTPIEESIPEEPRIEEPELEVGSSLVVETPAEAPAMDEVALEDALEPQGEAVSEPEKAEAGAEPGSESTEAEPKKRKPGGKVVGFVDLTKLQPAKPRKSDSRRLRSRDEETPNVQPTFTHDRKRALMRGDHASRGQLTAAQLREKEATRFLRRRTPTPSTGPQKTTPRVRSGEQSGSPFAGGTVKIDSPITIKKLAETLALKTNEVLKRAFSTIGLGVNINSTLDEETAVLLAHEFGVQLEVAHEIAAEEALIEELIEKRSQVEEAALAPREPIIAFLGHVDHGKTTLLDRLRNSRIVHGEAGGITQHLGAYQIETHKGHKLTVLDTPGHMAFTKMRARGAEAVDIVVLIVAADDGVMPHTVEAINHARAAKTPIVVAINKCDKPEAAADKVMNQLSAHDLVPEAWGGHTAMVQISALTGANVPELLERIILESELLELSAHSEGPASGIVLEAEIQEGKGKVAYLLVQDGTLNQGDIILAGEGYGRVRSIHNDRGGSIPSAGPSMPVEVSGLSELPSVGDHFYVVERLERAREVAEERARKNRALSLAERRKVTHENLLQAVAEQSKKMINVILKADVQGSLEALRPLIETLAHDEVEVKLLHSALGTVTESDVDLAQSSTALILAFHVSTNEQARQAAERAGIEIRSYEVIYELLDDLKAIMEGTLAPEMTEQVFGHAEVRRVFKSSKLGNIAGCFVRDGSITRDSTIRVQRGGEIIHTGPLASLRREKDDVREVREGFECGLVLKGFDAYEENDVLEAFKMVAVKRLLKI